MTDRSIFSAKSFNCGSSVDVVVAIGNGCRLFMGAVKRLLFFIERLLFIVLVILFRTLAGVLDVILRKSGISRSRDVSRPRWSSKRLF